MKVIQPNCRIQFTADDLDFIAAALGQKARAAQSLRLLLADPETRDLILDDQTLYHALLEHRGCLRVSNHFYFYVLVRNVLRKTGIEDRSVADYVAEMMAEYSRSENTRCQAPGQEGTLDYFFDMLAALQTADDRTRFMIRAHMGNHSLFMTGVFPQRIRHRAERKGFPDVKYYEALGRTSYRVASDHRLAAKYDLGGIFLTLSDRFEETRLALNEMADRLLTLHEPARGLESLLLAKLDGAGF